MLVAVAVPVNSPEVVMTPLVRSTLKSVPKTFHPAAVHSLKLFKVPVMVPSPVFGIVTVKVASPRSILNSWGNTVTGGGT